MRWLVLLTLLLMPASAQAGTIAREGSELVYRSAPGESDYIVVQDLGAGSSVSAGGTGVTPGTGCVRRSCSIDGITAVRVIAADGDDQVEVYVDLPVIVDLGPGNDSFGGKATALTVSGGEGKDVIGGEMGGGLVDGGPGDDRLRADASDALTGPLVIAGGAGDDQITLEGIARAGTSIAGGEGDDKLSTAEVIGLGPGTDVSCGPGDDRLLLYLTDRPGEGCAPGITGVTANTVSRAFDEGTLAGPAAVAVKLYLAVGRGTVARGFATFSAAGPLRLRLKTTDKGRRWVRRHPRLDVGVSIRTRFRGDVNDCFFVARLAR
ncbi:hypothetical protein OJ998_24720 [Solirubrobacter taibaiensis]|nr:hypothetical protein [Solirubrobacter taibaiensis]